jgi:hypothetical protein
MAGAEIIILPAQKKNKPEDGIGIDDVVLLFLSVLKMARERLTDMEFNELKKHIK